MQHFWGGNGLLHFQFPLPIVQYLFYNLLCWNSSSRFRPVLFSHASALKYWNQMIASAKMRGVNLHQVNQTLKIVMDYGLHLSLFTDVFVTNLHIDKDKAMSLKEKRPLLLVLTNTVLKLVHIKSLSLRSAKFMLWFYEFLTLKRNNWASCTISVSGSYTCRFFWTHLMMLQHIKIKWT